MTVDPSAAPVREAGVHSRAGNAMQRTRTALLDGAVRAIEKHGARRTTMADIAMLAGIAKGTLYNHFRTKEAVFAATLTAGITSLTQECVTVARDDLAEALALAADRVASHPALRRIALDEPAVLAALVTVGDDGTWATAKQGAGEVLTAGGAAGSQSDVDLVLRWLVSFVATPGHDLDRQAAALATAVASSRDTQAG